MRERGRGRGVTQIGSVLYFVHASELIIKFLFQTLTSLFLAILTVSSNIIYPAPEATD